MTTIWCGTNCRYVSEIDELLEGLPNVFGIADHILIAECDNMDRDCNATLNKVLRICRQTNLKLNKDKCFFRCMSIPFTGEVILQCNVNPDPRKVQALTAMPPPKPKKELQLFLGIINYLSKFSPKPAEVCESLWKLTSVKTEWSWDVKFQDLNDKVKI